MPRQPTVREFMAGDYLAEDRINDMVRGINAARLESSTLEVRTDATGTSIELYEQDALELVEFDGDVGQWGVEGVADRLVVYDTGFGTDVDWLQASNAYSQRQFFADPFGIPILDGTRALSLWQQNLGLFVPVVPFGWHYVRATEDIGNGAVGLVCLQQVSGGTKEDTDPAVEFYLRNDIGQTFAEDQVKPAMYHPTDGWYAPPFGAGGAVIEFGILKATLTGPSNSVMADIYDSSGADTMVDAEVRCWMLGASESIVSTEKVVIWNDSGNRQIINARCS